MKPVSEHPRVCGENRAMAEEEWCEAGTSPRMRGKHPGHHYPSHSGRNIPAYAGKTASIDDVESLMEEHPRVCGENSRFVPGCSAPIGTSPRMRGKLGVYNFQRFQVRNIPAYAGKT